MRALNKIPALSTRMVETIGSEQGLEDYMAEEPAVLWVWDEAAKALRFTGPGGGNPNLSALVDAITKLFSAGDRTMPRRLKVATKAKTPTQALIQHPHLSIIASGTAEDMTTAFTQTHISGGFLSRMLFINPGTMPRGERQRTRPEMPQELATWIAQVSNALERRTSLSIPIAFEPAALQYFEDFDNEIEDKKLDLSNDASLFLERAEELAKKVAALVAIAADWREPVITLNFARWAVRFVRYSLNYAVHELYPSISANKVQREVNKIVHYVSKAKELAKRKAHKDKTSAKELERMRQGWLSRTKLSRLTGHLSKQERALHIANAIEQRLIKSEQINGATYYRADNDA
jgi:hypothetical protein